MSLELLTLWGVGTAAWTVFRPIFEDLATDIAKDTAKSYVGRCFKNVYSAIHRDSLTRATGLAVRELLDQVQNELLGNGVDVSELPEWVDDLGRLAKDDRIASAVGELYLDPSYKLDAAVVAAAWQDQTQTRDLPDGFSWGKVARLFSVKVSRLRSGDADLRATFDSLATAQSAGHLAELAGLPAGFDLEKYREALEVQFGKLKLESLDKSGAYYANAVRLWNVFIPQNVRPCTQFHPQLLELPKEHQQRLIERGELDEAELKRALADRERAQQQYMNQPPVPAMKVIDQESNRRLVLLGDPGAGKSSLLRYVALRWARIDDPSLRYRQRLPLLIELGAYSQWKFTSGKSFLRYLHEGPVWHRLNQQTLNHLLGEEGRVVLLLDGLDEVFDPEARRAVVNDLLRFANENKSTPIIMTSRVVGYRPEPLRDAGFSHFILQDLSRGRPGEPGQVAEFLQKWHEVNFTDKADGDAKRDRLAKAIERSRAIGMLAGNPLLLTMMAILNRNQELPRDRASLYKNASDVLLERWDTERALASFPEISQRVDRRVKKEILRKVAHAMQSGTDRCAGNIISGDDLIGLIEGHLRAMGQGDEARGAANAVVAQLRERNFILCFVGADSYAFVHRTFMEYFAASEIVQQFNLKKTLAEADLVKLFVDRCTDETWTEALLLVCGMIDERFVAPIIDQLLARADVPNWHGDRELPELVLAVRCVEEVAHPSLLKSQGKRLIEALIQLATVFAGLREWKMFVELETSLCAIGPRWPGQMDRGMLDAALAAGQLCQGTGATILAALIVFVAEARDDAVFAATHPESTFEMRASAIAAMSRRWPDLRTRELLMRRVVKDVDGYVRRAAMEGLATAETDEQTRELLEQRCVKDDDKSCRRRALALLVDRWPTQQTRNLLIHRAAEDESEFPRATALASLVACWPDKQTRLLVEWRAVEDASYYPRCVALSALAEKWADSSTRLLLERRSVEDNFDDARATALQGLAQNWPDAQTRELLERRSGEDTGSIPKNAALEMLTTHWPDEQTQTFLRDQARQDGQTASFFAWKHSPLGQFVFSKNRDCGWPYLDPADPVSREHMEQVADLANVKLEELDAAVASLSAHMGWDITKGSKAAGGPGSA